MKTTDFKLWDVFLNTNNNMAVICKITDTHAHVISDKGSLYRLKMHDKEVSYFIVDNDPQEVFDAFPKSKLFRSYERKKFDEMLADFKEYHYPNQNKRKLLLLL